MVRGLIAGGAVGAFVAAAALVALSVRFPLTPAPVPVAPAVAFPEGSVPVVPVRPAEITLLPDGTIVPPSGEESQPAIMRFAAPAPHTTGPVLSVIILDTGVGSGGMDAATLAALDLPLTIALDPTRPGAGRDSARYRAAGAEVAVLATGISPDSPPQDVASAMADWHHAVPQAVAVIESPLPVFQNNQTLAQQVVVGLKSAGEGLLTQPLGDNVAQGLAETAGVPNARIWRVLDGQREVSADIIAALDQAAEQAIRSGGTAIMISAWPESVAALTEWAARPHPGVMLAPASALMLR